MPATEQERRWLACHALGASSAELLAHPERMGRPEVQALLRRREAGEPLQYILGEGTFWGRDFQVGPGVLIPRRDTELLVETALRLLPDRAAAFTLVDWGAGSGCIAATLLLEYPHARAVMVEKSPEARRYAERNLARFGLEGRAELTPSLEEPPLPKARLVVSNPPYIPTGAIPRLPREIRDHEPRLALDGGEDGLDAYRLLLGRAPRWLEPGGFLLAEAGDPAHAEALRTLPAGGLELVDVFSGPGYSAFCVTWRAH